MKGRKIDIKIKKRKVMKNTSIKNRRSTESKNLMIDTSQNRKSRNIDGILIK